ncbi:MAG TPA: FAD-dependent oxidoreductase [Solirubrobacterales bacterium]|nr:FAD-dependent oxidoreductase [Solirubrobacterales bacterium]
MVGGGAAGLWSALRAAELGARVCLVSRTPLSQSASYWAQGGLAAALEPDDSPDLHAADTIAAGRGLCRTSAVRVLVEEAPETVRDLIGRGVVFDLDHEGRLALGLEGGHTHRRIVHSGGSQTGYELTSKLAAMVARQERLEVMERTSAVALWSDGECCHGVVTDAGLVAAPATILATGGAAALWKRTTNPRGAIGAGPVLASLAGADLADLEFCQFHPTALAMPGAPHDGVLVTEAIRGEGAKLLGGDGERFTDELAPRDAVTAAILEKMRLDGTPSVDLDLREIDPARFPNVFASLAEAGLDPRSKPVPVTPAAHYTMGGIAVDIDGRSSLPGLYAVGECSCTGLHGANRLASNSLSECFVFGGRAAAAAIEEEPASSRPEPPQQRFDPPSDKTREAVWRYAGPMRNPDDLARLISNPYPLARAIGASAIDRRESRGGHLRRDAPDMNHALDGIHVVVHPDGSVTDEEWH